MTHPGFNCSGRMTMSALVLPESVQLMRHFGGDRLFIDSTLRRAFSLDMLPSIFAWDESEDILVSLDVSHREWSTLEVHRAMHDLARWDPELSYSMCECLEALPPW